MLNSLRDFWQAPLRTKKTMNHLKRGHTSPGFCRFSTEKEYFRLDFATPLSDIAWVLLGKLVRSSSRSRTPPAMESNADEALHSFSPSRPRVGSRARRQDWRDNFRSVTCFTLDFFLFSGASLHVFAVKFEAFFPWQISTHFCTWKLQTNIFHKVDLPSRLTFRIPLSWTLNSLFEAAARRSEGSSGSRCAEDVGPEEVNFFLTRTSQGPKSGWAISWKLGGWWWGFRGSFLVFFKSISSIPEQRNRKWAYSCCLP